MKRLLLAAFLVVAALQPTQVQAQSHEAQQLLLNVEKLAQFKKILQNMYDGYKVLHKGYTAVKDISEGNFTLHKTFLDGLLEVNPTVKKYKRVADIIAYQLRILREYRIAFQKFRDEKQFTPKELDFIANIYRNLFGETVISLDELGMVITASTLRMTDDERLQAIDRIYTTVEGQFSFLKDFTASTLMLSAQRKSAAGDIELSRRINGVK